MMPRARAGLVLGASTTACRELRYTTGLMHTCEAISKINGKQLWKRWFNLLGATAPGGVQTHCFPPQTSQKLDVLYDTATA